MWTGQSWACCFYNDWDISAFGLLSTKKPVTYLFLFIFFNEFLIHVKKCMEVEDASSRNNLVCLYWEHFDERICCIYFKPDVLLFTVFIWCLNDLFSFWITSLCRLWSLELACPVKAVLELSRGSLAKWKVVTLLISFPVAVIFTNFTSVRYLFLNGNVKRHLKYRKIFYHYQLFRPIIWCGLKHVC